MKKKRLLFFIGALHGGGAERVLIHLLKNLNRKKYELILVVNRDEGQLLRLVPEDVELIVRAKIRENVPALTDRIFGLPRIIKNKQADLVVSFLTGANRSLMRSRFLVQRGIKFVVREGNNPLHINTLSSNGFWRLITRLEVKYLYPMADRMITSSQGVKDEFVNEWGFKSDLISEIHNPVDIEKINLMIMEEVDLPWEKDISVKWLIAAGRLTEQKGFDDLIDIFIKVRKVINVRLMILGEGELKDHIEKRILSENLYGEVYMAGFVSNPWKYMKLSDLYLSTSKWEGFHLTIAEAMACGTVPVVTDCDFGPSEIIDDGVNGRLLPVGDVNAMSDAIIELLENENQRKRMSEKAIIRAYDFDTSKIIKQYEALFDRILENA